MQNQEHKEARYPAEASTQQMRCLTKVRLAQAFYRQQYGDVAIHDPDLVKKRMDEILKTLN